MVTRRIFAAGLLALGVSPARASDEGWEALKAGQAFVLMRHALAPGGGDPAGFKLGDCSTQRNLSDEGRAQARATGALLRDKGILQAAVFSSRWCRASETARLLDLGAVEELPLLDSFFGKPELGPERRAAFMEWLGKMRGGVPMILVTHQVTVSAFTGIVPASGEMVIARKSGDRVEVLGRVKV
jgi:phosphohistidine phosphatase SixA